MGHKRPKGDALADLPVFACRIWSCDCTGSSVRPRGMEDMGQFGSRAGTDVSRKEKV